MKASGKGANMRAQELIELLRKRPFVPLRIHMTDGQTYDIRHPEFVMVLKQRVDIGVPFDLAAGIMERVEYCSLLHIVRIEELSSATAADGATRNGGPG
jgi:hypothetical protein